jgi:hypothetical protein
MSSSRGQLYPPLTTIQSSPGVVLTDMRGDPGWDNLPKFALIPARISPRHGPRRSTVRPCPGRPSTSGRMGAWIATPRSTSLVPPIAAGIAAVPKASGVSLTLFRRTIVRVDDDNGKTVFEFPF